MTSLQYVAQLFDIGDGTVYLSCASRSPLLRTACDAATEALRNKMRPWTIPSGDLAGEARGLFAKLVHADASDIALTPSTSYAISVAASNVSLHAGQHVVVLEDQMSSNVLPWQARAQREGAHLRVVPWPDYAAGGTWTESVLRCIDADTGVVAVPPLHWSDGSLLDLERVGRRCREVGAALVVDGTQAVGAMPCDVRRWGAAFLACSVHKWLLSPYGCSFLYVSPAYQQGGQGAPGALAPLEHHSRNRSPRGGDDWDEGGYMTQGCGYPDSFKPGACRFDGGGRPNIHLLPAVIKSLEQVVAWRPERIAGALAPLAQRLATRARAMGWVVAPEVSNHIIGLWPAPGPVSALGGAGARAGTRADVERIASELQKRRIHIAARCGALRVSPYLYNTIEQMDTFCDALADVTAAAGTAGAASRL
eukprot:g1708.t1